MTNVNIRLWRDYKLGNLNRELTHEEIIEVETCENAMNLLLSTNSFLNLYNQYKSEGWTELQIFNFLCMTLRVPAEVFQVRMHELKYVKNYTVEYEDYTEIRNQNIKIRGNLGFWKVYKLGNLKRDLLPLEEIRINECDYVMNNIVLDNIFIPIYEVLKYNNINKERIITILAIRFKVPADIIEVKIYEYEKEKNNGPKLVK